jgi:DNA-binding NtrC family response regulator
MEAAAIGNGYKISAEQLKKFIDSRTGWRMSKGKDQRNPARSDRLLAEHDYPGNIRELRNLVERLVIISKDGVITPLDVRRVLPRKSSQGAAQNSLLYSRLENTEKALERGPGNRNLLGRKIPNAFKSISQIECVI